MNRSLFLVPASYLQDSMKSLESSIQILRSTQMSKVTRDYFCFYMRSRGLYIIPGVDDPVILSLFGGVITVIGCLFEKGS